MKQKKLAAITLVAATAVLGSGVSVNALPAVTSTDYTITIPATLEVANAGWNATDGITAQVKSGDTFDSSKKLTVTASSDDEFALVSGENKVGYNLATATGTYSATAEVPVWEFSADELNETSGTNKAMGIIVEDYSSKPAGTYQDTVTFTASVEDAAPAAVDLDTTTAAWTDGSSFAVPAGGLTYSDAISVSGDVTLTLTDGETLTLNKGISLAEGATLTIQGNGTMNVNGTNGNANSTVAGTGTLVLKSGTVTVKGGNGGDNRGVSVSTGTGGAAINGAVTVNGGTLTATGGRGGNLGERSAYSTTGAGGAAISGSVTINAGTVTATGGNGGTIGEMSMGANTGAGGAGIDGSVTINGGELTTTNGTGGGGQNDGTRGAGGAAVAGTVTDNR